MGRLLGCGSKEGSEFNRWADNCHSLTYREYSDRHMSRGGDSGERAGGTAVRERQ